MRAPVRLVRGGWPRVIERVLDRFVRDDPAAITSPDVSSDSFRRIVSSLHVGDTIKITGSNRHPEADALLARHLELDGVTIVDIGASDGSTSVDLATSLPAFGSYVIADLYLTATYLHHRRRLFVYDASGTCVLVAGRRLVAWPALSRAVRLLYRSLLASAQRRAGDRQELLLLNPSVRELMRDDPRVSYRVHDVFTVWTGAKPDVIKIANLLRRLYFSDADIARALGAVHASLPTGGHLLIVDNPRIAGITARGGLYRRTEAGYDAVARTDEEPEIDDLISGYRAGPARATGDRTHP